MRLPCVARPGLVLPAGLVCLVFLGGLFGCRTPLKDPFLAAEYLAGAGSFLEALALLDDVPPAHSRYAEARAFAQALERRMRTSQEMVLRGMAMRNEWRDEEAIRNFEQALSIWPGVAGARGLILATNNRMRALESGAVERLTDLATNNSTLVQKTPDFEQLRTQPVGEDPGGTDPTVENPPVTNPPAAPGGSAPRLSKEQRRRIQRLVAVQGHLERGEMERAMDLLEMLRLDHPRDEQLARMFARVLHQRALLRYGQGFLEGAVEDWKRVLELRGRHRQAQAFLQAAETELKLRRQR